MELGKCFESSYKAFMNLNNVLPEWVKGRVQNVRLVHGLVTGTQGPNKGIVYSHGWVEFSLLTGEEFCLDTETGYLVVKSTYYTVSKIKDVMEYEMSKAIKNICRFKHHGPWAEKLIEAEKEVNPTFRCVAKGVDYE